MKNYNNNGISSNNCKWKSCFQTFFYATGRLTLSHLLPGNKRYTKYIILALARTGSNYLASSLNSNQYNICHGEIFNNAKPEVIFSAYRHLRIANKNALRTRNSSSTNFINKYVFHNMPNTIQAVGFKMFLYHGSCKWLDVWDSLESINDLKIIHLRRRNKLKQFISNMVALKTNEWVKRSGDKEKTNYQTNKPRVEIEYQDCLKQFEQIDAWEHMRDDRLIENERLDIYFEDLLSNHTNEMRKIHDFLGVTHMDTISNTKRQSTSLRDTILNYDKLKKQFSSSKWEKYFDE